MYCIVPSIFIEFYYIFHIFVDPMVINAMDQLFKDLSCSQEKDSSWISKLIVDIPTPPQLNFVDIETSIHI